jgi:hypothetical protein
MPDPQALTGLPADREVARGVSGWDIGLSLRDHVGQHGALDESLLHLVAVVSAATLASLHESGWVHGDLGPDNIVLSSDGPRVLGTHLAKRDHSAGPVADGQLMTGQARDLFAWAVTMVFAAGGVLPPATDAAAGGDARSAEPAVPEALRAVLQECMTDARHRPTARQVLRLLSAPTPTRGLGEPAADEASRMRPPTQVSDRWSRPDAAVTMVMSSKRPLSDGKPRSRRRGSGRIAVLSLLAMAAVAVATSPVGRRELGALLPGSASWPSTPVVTAGAAAPDVSQAPASVTPKVTPTVPPTVPPTVTPTVTPSVLTGQWRGTLTQSHSPKALTVQVTFRGSGGGQIVLPGVGCTGTLTVARTLADRTVFRDLLTKDLQGSCARSGTVTIRRLGASSLELRWVNDAAPFNSATGVLQPG